MTTRKPRVDMDRLDNPVIGMVEVRASDLVMINSMFGVTKHLMDNPELAMRSDGIMIELGAIAAVQISGHSNQFIEELHEMHVRGRKHVDSERTLLASSMMQRVSVPPEVEAAMNRVIRALKEARHAEETGSE